MCVLIMSPIKKFTHALSAKRSHVGERENGSRSSKDLSLASRTGGGGRAFRHVGSG